jgi:(p)ppGpp synthase/HD superfamily hydrolase
MPLNWNRNKYIYAYLYAAEALNTKKLPGTDLPYMVHVSLVSMEVLATLQVEPWLNGDLAIQCALLHDVIEDTEKKRKEIEKVFGTAVADGVSALSKNPHIPDKSTQMQDSLSRIQQQPREVWIVKMADRITNLQPPPAHWTQQRIDDYRKEAVEIYNSLHSASVFLAERLLANIEKYGNL